MGYTTDFNGCIEIEPPLPAEVVEEFNAFCEERHDPGYTEEQPSIWCDWVARHDGTAIEWNGSEKSYEMDKWAKHLIRDFIKPAGCVANGTMRAQGEDSDDRWAIVVKDNVVFRQEYKAVPEGEPKPV